jgi:hypothetical protein
VLGGLVSAAAVLIPAAAAHADVVTPPGACYGAGKWVGGNLLELSTSHQRSDVITVPQKDTVQWAGGIGTHKPGETGARRAIAGKVRFDLPIGGSVDFKTWGGSSTKLANTGSTRYSFPTVLVGLKIKLSGFHKDGGALTCSGSVYVRIAGKKTKNPLFWGGLGALVVGAVDDAGEDAVGDQGDDGAGDGPPA